MEERHGQVAALVTVALLLGLVLFSPASRAGPTPTTALLVGTPSHLGVNTWITSLTPLTLNVTDPTVNGVAYSEYRVDGLPWTTYSGPFTIPGETAHTVDYRSVTTVGDIEPFNQVTLVVEGSPPQTTLAPGSPKYDDGSDLWITPRTRLTLTAEDNPPSPILNTTFDLWVYQDNVTGDDFLWYMINASLRINWTVLPGIDAVVFTLRPYLSPNCNDLDLGIFRDANLNGTLEPEELVDFQADADASEQVSLLAPIPGLYVAAILGFSVVNEPCSAQLVISTAIPGGGSGVSSVTYRVFSERAWGLWENYTAPFNISREGRAYVEYRAEDFLGNMEPTNNDTFIVDGTPPDSVLQPGAPNYTAEWVWVTSATELGLAAVDRPTLAVGLWRTSYQVWSNGSWEGTWRYTGAFRAPASEGRAFVTFQSWDLLYNMEVQQNMTVVVDNTAPTTNLTVGSPRFRAREEDPWMVLGATPILLATADGGPIPVGIRDNSYRVDNGTWITTAGAVSLAGQVDGAHDLEVRSSDLLGNTETAWTTTLVVDNTPPRTLGRFIPRDVGGIVYELVATDALSGVAGTRYSVNGGDAAEYSGPLAFTRPGTYVVTYWSEDHLGNAEPAQTTTVVVPNWKPVLALVFAVVIAIAGALALRKKSPGWEPRATRAWARFTLPWVAVELATGVAALFLEALMIPPLLGLGLALDVVLLAFGIAVPIWLIRKERRKESFAQSPEEEPAA